MFLLLSSMRSKFRVTSVTHSPPIGLTWYKLFELFTVSAAQLAWKSYFQAKIVIIFLTFGMSGRWRFFLHHGLLLFSVLRKRTEKFSAPVAHDYKRLQLKHPTCNSVSNCTHFLTTDLQFSQIFVKSGSIKLKHCATHCHWQLVNWDTVY